MFSIILLASSIVHIDQKLLMKIYIAVMKPTPGEFHNAFLISTFISKRLKDDISIRSKKTHSISIISPPVENIKDIF